MIGNVSGITRPHLCLYSLFRLFKSIESKYSVRLACQVCALLAQTCAPFALKRTGTLSRSFDKKRTYPRVRIGSLLAERVGFEPTIPFRGIHDFQSCSLGHLGHLSSIVFFGVLRAALLRRSFIIRYNSSRGKFLTKVF